MQNTSQFSKVNQNPDLEIPMQSQSRLHGRYASTFWSNDPETTKHRSMYLKIVILGVFLTILLIFGVLSIYWGALWKVQDGIHNFDGWVVVRTISYLRDYILKSSF